MNSKEIGTYGEKITAFYLEKKGYKIIGRNYCIKGGEIDIIAVKDDIIAFVEVKTRTLDSIADGFEAVTKSKKKLIIKTAAEYSYKNPHDYQPRFDVVSIILDNKKVAGFNYIENAFDATDCKIIF
jgi:putative endonuclease